MKNFDWEAFSNRKVCVACPTKELALDFLKKADEKGFKWHSGSSLLSNINWSRYGEETIYYGNGLVAFGDGKVKYGNNSSAIENGIEVITWGTYTFGEVVVRIQEGEVYESVDSRWSTKAIKMVDGELVIVNDRCSRDLIVGATNYRLKEEKKKKYRIVTVEHKESGKGYTFISDFVVNIGDFVSCDTRYGLSFGRVVSRNDQYLTEKQAQEYKKIVKVY